MTGDRLRPGLKKSAHRELFVGQVTYKSACMKISSLPQKTFVWAILAWLVLMPTGIAQNSKTISPIGGENASFGLCIIDTESGDVVAAHQAEAFFTPASTQKLITAATLLMCYQPEQRLTTRVFYDGTISKRGHLSGSLYIRGCGDPSLGSKYAGTPSETFVEEVVQAVKKAGISTISGTVVADDRAMAGNPVVSKWLWEDVGNYYAAGCYGINYADNLFTATFRTSEPDSQPVLLDINPEVEGLRIDYSGLSTNRSGRDSAYFYGAPYEYTRRLYGSLPAHRETFTIKGDLPDPPYFLATQLTAALRHAGIKVMGQPTTARQLHESGEELPGYETEGHLLYLYTSPTLAEMLHHMLTRSDNLYAEALLRQVALTVAPTSTLSGSIEQMKKIWRETGFPIDDATIYDGSGLSPLNRITPLMMCRLLAHVTRLDNGGGLLPDLLPKPGEGTLKRLMPDPAVAPFLRLKSGSMTDVQCYAGYYTGRHTYAVVVMVNHFSDPRNQVQQEIADMLSRLFLSIENDK